MPGTLPLVDNENVRHDVDAVLSERLDALQDRLTAVDPTTTPLIDEARALVSGGKRLRAAFCYWSWRAHGGAFTSSDRNAAIGAGAALELFQAAALVHDDVMDNSDTRRGRPAAHRGFAALHRSEHWEGDPHEFGTNAAILLGDMLLSACGEQLGLATASLDPALASSAREVFDLMQTEVTIGQYLDVRAQVMPWGTDHDADEAQSRGIIRAKSARYSVEHPIALGAALAGANPSSVSVYGLPLGEAFQLRDDLLGVFGDPDVTGKPAGDDVKEGKRTVLASRALRAASKEQRALILTSLGDQNLPDDQLTAVRTALIDTGAVTDVEQLIADLTTTAENALKNADLSDDPREMLLRIGYAAVRRAE